MYFCTHAVGSDTLEQAVNLYARFRRVFYATTLVCGHLLQAQSAATTEQRFQSALAAQQQGDTATAERLYRELLKSHPDALPARVNLAGMMADSGELDAAVAQYRAGLKFAPTSKDLHSGLAYALGRRGKPDDLKAALAELEPLHRNEPVDEQVSMLLANAYVRQNRFAEAMPLLVHLDQAHPQDRDIAWLTGETLIRTGHLQDGLQRIDAVAASDGSADAYLLAGEARLDLQQFDQAKTDAEAALKENPNISGGYTLLGRTLEHLGEYPASEAALRKAVAIDGDDYQAQFYLGALLYFNRNLPEAEQHLRKALALQPDSAEALYKIALIEETNGALEPALRDLKIVTAQRPQWLEPHSKLLALLYRLGRNDEAAKVKAVIERLKAIEKPPASRDALR